MKLCDLHADTAYELYTRSVHLDGDETDITLGGMGCYESYVQLSAVCASSRDSDSDGWDKFFAVHGYFEKEAERFSLSLCKSAKDIENATASHSPALIMTVEDARILEGDISRLDALFSAGVRVITPLWGGSTVVGGAHDTDDGLTPFGKELMHACASLGIITDISHASKRSADSVIDIALSHGMPVIASHSCAEDIFPHSRNLCSEHLAAIVGSGGIVGCNLYPYHLTGCESSDINDVTKHLGYYIRNAEGHVALGCDFDGMGKTKTVGLEKLSDLPALHAALGESGDRVFWDTPYSFLINNISG